MTSGYSPKNTFIFFVLAASLLPVLGHANICWNYVVGGTPWERAFLNGRYPLGFGANYFSEFVKGNRTQSPLLAWMQDLKMTYDPKTIPSRQQLTDDLAITNERRIEKGLLTKDEVLSSGYSGLKRTGNEKMRYFFPDQFPMPSGFRLDHSLISSPEWARGMSIFGIVQTGESTRHVSLSSSLAEGLIPGSDWHGWRTADKSIIHDMTHLSIFRAAHVPNGDEIGAEIMKCVRKYAYAASLQSHHRLYVAMETLELLDAYASKEAKKILLYSEVGINSKIPHFDELYGRTSSITDVDLEKLADSWLKIVYQYRVPWGAISGSNVSLSWMSRIGPDELLTTIWTLVQTRLELALHRTPRLGRLLPITISPMHTPKGREILRRAIALSELTYHVDRKIGGPVEWVDSLLHSSIGMEEVKNSGWVKERSDWAATLGLDRQVSANNPILNLRPEDIFKNIFATSIVFDGR